MKQLSISLSQDLSCLPHVLRIIRAGMKNKAEVTRILEKISSGEEESVKKYILDHGFKIGVALENIKQIHDALNITENHRFVQNPSLLMVILVTNLDKILDYLPPNDPRFGEFFQFYADIVLGNPLSPISVNHPKFRELEILAHAYKNGIKDLPDTQGLHTILQDLVNAVMEQRNSSPVSMEEIEFSEYLPLKKEVESLLISQEAKNALFLAVRLGISTFNVSLGLASYSKSKFSTEEQEILDFICLFNGLTQVMDDLLDKDRDKESGIFTYATAFPEDLPAIERWIRGRWKELSIILDKNPKIPRLFYHGFHAYPLITRFISGGDQDANPPYNLPFLRRD